MNYDLSKHLTTEAQRVVYNAQLHADQLKHSSVEPIHILSTLLSREDVRSIFLAISTDLTKLNRDLERAIKKMPADAKTHSSVDAIIPLVMRATKIAKDALPAGETLSADSVNIGHLLNALSHEIRSSVGEIFQAHDLLPGVFRPHTHLIREDGSITMPEPVVEATATKQTKHYTRNLIVLAKNGRFDPTIGRTDEMQRLLNILVRRTKHHPLLVGAVGTGKFAIVSELANRLAHGDVPPHLSGFGLLELNVAELLAGSRLRGDEVEKRINAVHKYVGDTDTILFVRGIETLADQPSGSLVKALVSKDNVRIIGSTTPDGLRKMVEKEPAATEEFAKLDIEPTTMEETTAILRALAPRYESHHRLTIGEEPIAAAVRLAKRYLQDRALPEPAIDLLDEAAARKRGELDGMPASLDRSIRDLSALKMQVDSLSNDKDAISVKALKKLESAVAEVEPATKELKEKHAGKGATERVLTEEDVAQVLESWTGVPVSKLCENEIEKMSRLEERLRLTVVGQDEAVAAVSQAVRRARLGLRDPKRPIGSFFFLGSSGVGKTLVAKALAAELFGSADAMLRLDMSEYRESHQASKLIGSPPGYKDSDSPGLLTGWVTKRPNSVLLFDELEKCCQPGGGGAVPDLLLGILDDGRLTDAKGCTADFSNTVIVMTSNIGTRRLLDADPKMFETEEGRAELQHALIHDELSNYMRPEFLNRVDNIITFRPLLKDTLLKVADIELRYLDALLASRELTVRVSDAAKQALVDDEFNASFGARPLRRAITKHLQSPLTEVLMRGGYNTGDVITVDYVDGSFRFGRAS